MTSSFNRNRSRPKALLGATVAVALCPFLSCCKDPPTRKNRADPSAARKPNTARHRAYRLLAENQFLVKKEWNMAATVSRDGTLAAIGTHAEVVLVDLRRLQELRRWVPYPGSTVDGLAFSPDGGHLVTYGGAQELKVWDLKRNKLLKKKQLPRTYIMGISYDRSGKYIIVRGTDELRLHRSRSLRMRKKIKTRQSRTGAIAVSPDNTMVASERTGTARVVDVWNRKTGRQMMELKSHGGDITKLAFSPDGNTLAAASSAKSGDVQLWWLPTGQRKSLVPFPNTTTSCVMFSDDNRLLYIGDGNHRFLAYDLATGKKSSGGHVGGPVRAFGRRGTELIVVSATGSHARVSRWRPPKEHTTRALASGSTSSTMSRARADARGAMSGSMRAARKTRAGKLPWDLKFCPHGAVHRRLKGEYAEYEYFCSSGNTVEAITRRMKRLGWKHIKWRHTKASAYKKGSELQVLFIPCAIKPCHPQRTSMLEIRLTYLPEGP